MTSPSAVGQPFRFGSVGLCMGDSPIDVADRYPEAANLVDKTGIPTVWQASGSAYELAVSAANGAIEGVARGSVGAVLYVTQSPTWHLPAHACRLQQELGLSSNLLAFDMGQGCSGFVQALSLAARLLAQVPSVLIVTADTYRAKLSDEDRGTQAIFSDGAAAVVVSADDPTHLIAAESHLTDGSGADLLVQRTGTEDADLVMMGRDVYLFTRRVVGEQMRATVEAAGVSLGDVDIALVHQASKLVVDGIVRDLSGHSIEVPTNLDPRGNTVSSTIPILMADTGLPRPGQTALMSGFGVGLSCSTLLLQPS